MQMDNGFVNDMISSLITAGGSILTMYTLMKNYKKEWNDILQTELDKRYNSEKAEEERKEVIDKLNRQSEYLKDLLESDKSRIRREITMEYCRCKKQGFIESKTLDYLIHQYDCYKHEGGNSYIERLMKELEKMEIREGDDNEDS